MTKLIDQVLQLTGQLMGGLLDWPFLLFVLAVLLGSRYRHQIGSMLDRRGAVPAGDISKAVRRELEPIRKQMDEILPAVSELRFEMEKIQALNSEAQLAAVLEPVNSRIRSIEGAISGIRPEVEKLFGKELTQALDRERESSRKEMATLAGALDDQQGQLSGMAPRDMVDRLNVRMESAAAELASLKGTLNGVQTVVAKSATLEVTDRLQTEITPLASGIQQIKQAVDGLEETLRSLRAEVEGQFAGQLGPINQEVASIRESLEQLRLQAERSAQETVPPAADRPQPAAAAGPADSLKQALVAAGKQPRLVEVLAKSVGLSEEQTEEMLGSIPGVKLGMNSKGKRTARLIGR